MLQQSLMLALIAEGRFDEALPYAEKLKNVPEVERLSRLALAIDAFPQEGLQRRRDLADVREESDLDGLIAKVMIAWAKLGRGDTNGAHGDARRTGRAGLVQAFRRLPAQALIAEQAGLTTDADAAYQSDRRRRCRRQRRAGHLAARR